MRESDRQNPWERIEQSFQFLFAILHKSWYSMNRHAILKLNSIRFYGRICDEVNPRFDKGKEEL